MALWLCGMNSTLFHLNLEHLSSINISTGRLAYLLIYLFMFLVVLCMEILSLIHTPKDIKQENNLCPRGKGDVRLYYVYLLSDWHLKQKKGTECGPC